MLPGRARPPEPRKSPPGMTVHPRRERKTVFESHPTQNKLSHSLPTARPLGTERTKLSSLAPQAASAHAGGEQGNQVFDLQFTETKNHVHTEFLEHSRLSLPLSVSARRLSSMRRYSFSNQPSFRLSLACTRTLPCRPPRTLLSPGAAPESPLGRDSPCPALGSQ